MILYLLVVFLLLSQGVFAEKPENYTVRNVHWGMTPEEVKEEESKREKNRWKEAKGGKDNQICYEGKWKSENTSTKAKVCFNFINKRLISLEYDIHGDVNLYKSILHELKVKRTPTDDGIIHDGLV